MDLTMLGTGTLGALIGSVLTVLIGRILDIIQRKKEHYFNLKKAYFERKLSVAEAAISRQYIIASCLKSLSLLFDVVVKNTALIIASPPDFLKNYMDSISQQMAKVSAPALDPANAVSLFFDLDELQDLAMAKDVMDLMMSIEGRFAALKFLAQYIYTQDESIRQRLLPMWNEMFTEMQSDIKKLSVKIAEGSLLISNFIGKIRGEMKKFES